MNFEILEGQILSEIKVEREDENQILFKTNNNIIYIMEHEQECCENVYIEDICGDIQALVGHKILLAEEVSNEGTNEDGTETWTYYKLATEKDSITIRWYGESNGYYSESVSFEKQD